MTPATFTIRPYQPRDLLSVYEVCLRTGDAGSDASHLHDDPMALGHLYVGPYITLEPEFAFVLESENRVCGYVLGALDTVAFNARQERYWLPALRRLYPQPQGEPATWSPTEALYHLYHRTELDVPDPLKQYPSHMHIDLLPEAQGRGNGTKMTLHLLERFRESGAKGVHLGMNATNTRAERFYRKLGFEEVCRVAHASGHTELYLGMALT